MIRYDEALPRFAAIANSIVGDDDLLSHLFLREAEGRLTFVPSRELDPSQISAIREQVVGLAPWVDVISPVATPDELFDPSLESLEAGTVEYIDSECFRGFIRVVERRIVGQDWLRPPAEPIDGVPPIFVFASHKGGVGRSTALAVATSTLARRGLSILTLDFDLESPGLGSMLLDKSPRFGLLDYFVESSLRELDSSFLEDLIASSPFAGAGAIHVVPATGVDCKENPGNVLGKIARAYLDRPLENGGSVSFLDRARKLVEVLSNRFTYDAIFVDARAGLNETTAAVILGLGAEVLLFGTDMAQTFEGYLYLLSHLGRFRPSKSTEDDWRYRLRMVHAKASADPLAQAEFRTRAYDTFADTVYDSEDGLDEEAFNFDYEDVNAPHYAWPILDDSNYTNFNPLVRGDQMAEHMIDRTFNFLIVGITDKMRQQA